MEVSMGLDIYFPEDIARILAALSQANARNGTEAYQAALDDVAAAFGLTQVVIVMEVGNERQIECVQQQRATEP
jgi:hypothetical protein